jgi:hypothetical protein
VRGTGAARCGTHPENRVRRVHFRSGVQKHLANFREAAHGAVVQRRVFVLRAPNTAGARPASVSAGRVQVERSMLYAP